jgi:hypothetical protein
MLEQHLHESLRRRDVGGIAADLLGSVAAVCMTNKMLQRMSTEDNIQKQRGAEHTHTTHTNRTNEIDTKR